MTPFVRPLLLFISSFQDISHYEIQSIYKAQRFVNSSLHAKVIFLCEYGYPTTLHWLHDDGRNNLVILNKDDFKKHTSSTSPEKYDYSQVQAYAYVWNERDIVIDRDKVFSWGPPWTELVIAHEMLHLLGFLHEERGGNNIMQPRMADIGEAFPADQFYKWRDEWLNDFHTDEHRFLRRNYRRLQKENCL